MKHKLRTYILLFLILLLPAWPWQYAAAQSVTVPVQALFGVNVRSGPGASFPKVGELRRWEIVRSTVADGDWTIIRFGENKEGYVRSEYLREWTDDALTDGYVRATVDSDVLNGPSPYAKWLGTAKKGQLYAWTAQTDDWYEINFYGRTGFLSKLYAVDLGAEVTLPEPSTGGEAQQGQQENTQQPEKTPTQQGGTPEGNMGSLVPAGKNEYVEVTQTAYVYARPSLDSAELGELLRGSLILKRGTVGGWIQVELTNRLCYIEGKHVQKSNYTPDMMVKESGYEAAALEMIRLVNAYRKEAGVKELEVSQLLMDAAKVRAQEISEVYSHIRPDGSQPNSLAPNDISGENIARGTALPTPEAAAKAFMASDAHRSNALSTVHTRIGVWCVAVGGEVYWVQLFGY